MFGQDCYCSWKTRACCKQLAWRGVRNENETYCKLDAKPTVIGDERKFDEVQHSRDPLLYIFEISVTW